MIHFPPADRGQTELFGEPDRLVDALEPIVSADPSYEAANRLAANRS